MIDTLIPDENLEEPIGPEFAASSRRGLAQADASDTVECRDIPEMVEKLLG